MRQKCGLTQEQLAESVDISQHTPGAIERGENFAAAETVDKLLKSLNTASKELFALNHLKPFKKPVEEINENIIKIVQDQLKLEIVYNITKSLIKE